MDYFDKGTPLESAAFRKKLNDIAEMAMRAGKIHAGAGLYVNATSMGTLIGLSAVADQVCVVKLTGNATGGGKYYGRILSGQSSAIASPTLAMPEGMTVPDADDALCLNPEEDGLGTHRLAANTFPIGIIVGADDTGKKIVVLSSTFLPVPQYQFQVYGGVCNNTWGFDFPRAHPMF